MATLNHPDLHMHLQFPAAARKAPLRITHTMNNFFEAMVAKNLTAARKDLRVLRAKSSQQATRLVYLNCLDIYATHLQLSAKRLNFEDIKYVAEEITAIKVDNPADRATLNAISSKLVNCLDTLRHQAHVVPALDSAIGEYTRMLQHKFDVHHAPPETTKQRTRVDTDYYGLCQYIADTPFTKYGTGRPMYEVYCDLQPHQKDQFMAEYLEHNRQRELHVEANCLSLLGTRNQLGAGLHFYLAGHWSKQLESAMRLEARGPLQVYGGILRLLPREEVARIVINNMYALCVSSNRAYVKLFLVVHDTLHLFNHAVMARLDLRSLGKHYQEVFLGEDGLKLVSHLVHLAIRECTIPPSLVADAFPEGTEFLADFGQSDPADPKRYQAFSLDTIRDPDKRLYRNLGIIRPHPYLVYDIKGRKNLPFTTKTYLPMLVPPRSWTSPHEGGYLENLQPILHSDFTDKSLEYLRLANATSQLNSTFRGLDYLGSQAWAIHPDMLRVFEEAMRKPDGMLDISPPLDQQKMRPVYFPKRAEFASEQEYLVHLGNAHSLRAARARIFHNGRSMRISSDLLLAAAKAFAANGDIFFLPHQLDFRGRAYPMTSVISHYQSDVTRSLMMFWHGEKLGDNGEAWLWYQLAANCGLDKLPMAARQAYVRENMERILALARDPFGETWWQRAEKPWQTLAVCFEVARLEAHKAAGHPAMEFVSRIPVALDGSCNGLQHYAALGADVEAARSCNVVPNPAEPNVRQDVYSAVLEIVRKKAAEEDDGTDPVKQAARRLLSRKLIKQTVMTTVYGVTQYGATEQVTARIRELVDDGSLEESFCKQVNDNLRPIGLYVARTVLASISELFSSAKLIQDWLLMNCHRVISSWDPATVKLLEQFGISVDFDSATYYRPMMWTTVGGFPVVQMYLKPLRHAVQTSLQMFSVREFTKPTPVDNNRHMNGVAPNFIHSLDLTHMFMTCLAAHTQGLAFAAVHDSFWTNPKDVERLSKIIREEFARLHSTPITQALLDDMKYTVREAYLVVWVENKTCPEFVDKLYTLRGWTKGKKNNFNKALRAEIDNTAEVDSLVREYQPTLYMKMKGEVCRYDDPKIKANTRLLAATRWTPLWVPVHLLDIPPKGPLDVKEVMDSPYFFS